MLGTWPLPKFEPLLESGLFLVDVFVIHAENLQVVLTVNLLVRLDLAITLILHICVNQDFVRVGIQILFGHGWNMLQRYLRHLCMFP